MSQPNGRQGQESTVAPVRADDPPKKDEPAKDEAAKPAQANGIKPEAQELSEEDQQLKSELELLVECEAADNRLENSANGDVVLADETAVVDVGEDAHEEPEGRPRVSIRVHAIVASWRIRTGSPSGRSYRHARECCGRSP